MRSKNRLRNSDFKKIQSSLKEKAQREKQTLINLMDLPDCDVTEFLQQLMKNQNYENVLEEIPEQKKIDFFAKNYKNFIQTQEQLMSFKLPTLPEITKSKQFHLKLKEQGKAEQDPDEASVIQIIDSFSTHVLQKNTEQVLRLYKIILDMKEHSRYGKFFYTYSINKIFRESYISFVQNSKDLTTLLKLNETVQAIKVFFQQNQAKIFTKINPDLAIDSSVQTLNKTLKYILNQIQLSGQEFSAMFKNQIDSQPQLGLYFSKWISKLALSFYHSIQSFIYEEQQISQILKNLAQILQTSKQIESKGISLYREFRNLISTDLPSHLQKILEVVLQSFDDILKYDNELFQFIEVKSLGAIPKLSQSLNLVSKKEFDKKCCSKKGILLINSFYVILMPLCDDKWTFLHENVLQAIIDKVKAMLQQQKIRLPMWDYYHLFMFFYQLGKGKIRHQTLFDSSNSSYLKDQITKIKKLSDECRFIFENTLIQSFWTEILSIIPKLLWEFKRYAQTTQRSKSGLKPTTLSIQLIFKIEEFFKQLQFRLSKQHFQYLALQFYEYVVYVIEYILFWSYHQKGANAKVFTLYKKQQRFLNKAKETFPIQQLPAVKSRQILKLSSFTKFGFERFVIDIYFLSDAYKLIVGKCDKIKADQFLYKISRILAKQQKNEPADTERKLYNELLKQFVDVYENRPEVIKKYLNQKRNVESGSFDSSSSALNTIKSKKRQDE